MVRRTRTRFRLRARNRAHNRSRFRARAHNRSRFRARAHNRSRFRARVRLRFRARFRARFRIRIRIRTPPPPAPPHPASAFATDGEGWRRHVCYPRFSWVISRPFVASASALVTAARRAAKTREMDGLSMNPRRAIGGSS
jgi:hypothetical protein